MSVRRGVRREIVCAILTSGRRISEGPGHSWKESRAFCSLARMKARSRCLYARNSWRCPVPHARSMRASEKSYRLYSCGRCAKQVRICGDCDRGNRYCAEGCAPIRRRESRCRASQRYQQSHRGACKHAARSRAWRERHAQKVTHQGFLATAVALIVVSSSTTTPTQEPHAETACVKPPLPIAMRRAHPRLPIHHTTLTAPRCCFCGCVLPHFARLGRLRSGA